MQDPRSAADFSDLDTPGISRHHWKILLISGMGFFTDAYDLFIIGVVMALIRPMWHVGRFEEGLVESSALLASAFGAILFGRLADMLGGKRIYGLEVLILAAGALGCAFAKDIWWLIGLRFVLGIGIGGDYPVSATIMAEYAGKNSRGLLVTLVFTMQAVGLILGPLFASALLTTHLSHAVIWRVLLGFGAVPALGVYWSRRNLKETPRFLAAVGTAEDKKGLVRGRRRFRRPPQPGSFWDGFHKLLNDKRLLRRLIGASAAWFLMDAAYYGNTVSSPLVLSVLHGDHTLLRKTMTQLIVFVVFAAPGYAMAVMFMDRLGRKTIQLLGFAVMTLTFALLAFVPNLATMTIPFIVIYGVSFFFTEFGPNATTFVYPAEIFPVRVRTTGHGISAALGKLGGFIGVFLFPFLMHWKGLLGAEATAAIASLIGFIVTARLLPETKGKSLEEMEIEMTARTEEVAA